MHEDGLELNISPFSLQCLEFPREHDHNNIVRKIVSSIVRLLKGVGDGTDIVPAGNCVESGSQAKDKIDTACQ